MSPRSTGRHRKTRLPSRRTLSVATGAATAALAVAVTTGGVRLPLVAPGYAHEGDARGAQTAEPVSRYVGSTAPSEAGGGSGSGSAGRDTLPGSRSSGTATRSAAPTATRSAAPTVAPAAAPTGGPTAAADASAYAAPSRSASASSNSVPSPSAASPTPSEGNPLSGLPLPLPTVTPMVPHMITLP